MTQIKTANACQSTNECDQVNNNNQLKGSQSMHGKQSSITSKKLLLDSWKLCTYQLFDTKATGHL